MHTHIYFKDEVLANPGYMTHDRTSMRIYFHTRMICSAPPDMLLHIACNPLELRVENACHTTHIPSTVLCFRTVDKN